MDVPTYRELAIVRGVSLYHFEYPFALLTPTHRSALKLRYLAPLVAPGQNAPPGPEPPILFDARVVARRDPGWEETLERVVRRWVDAVVAEKRAEV